MLVANRGEIAVRVIRALREMGLRSIAIHSDADADAPHVRMADEAIAIGGNSAAESYLDIAKILDAAKQSGAEAIHPGYGFLSENADFADACVEAGIVFIGPRGDVIRAMGSKVESRKLMAKAGVPIVPGDTKLSDSVERCLHAPSDRLSDRHQGGVGRRRQGLSGRGRAEAIAAAFEGAVSEGQRFFNDGSVYVERYLPNPRHIEVQVVADEHGNVVHLGERDCSVQRRHQKLIEEAPAPAVDDALREKIGAIAVNAARTIGYSSVGTIEGLLVDGEFYFLEMNTRLQVEHPVTELVTGIDLVRTQIEIAQGHPAVGAGRDRLSRLRDRMPHQRRGRRQGFSAAPGHGDRLSRAGRSGRARRQRHRGRQSSAPTTIRCSPSSSSGTPTATRQRRDAARAGRIRDRRREDAAALPP